MWRRILLICSILSSALPSHAGAQDTQVLRELPKVETAPLLSVGQKAKYDPVYNSIQLGAVRAEFKDATGAGLAVVIIDSGVNIDHVVFRDRDAFIPDLMARDGIVGFDFTEANVQKQSVDDSLGHGTFAASIIAARDVVETEICSGIAPEAKIIPLKIVASDNFFDLERLERSLKWCVDHTRNRPESRWKTSSGEVRIGVVNVSLGLGRNFSNVNELLANLPEAHINLASSISKHIQQLKIAKVPVVVSSGNGWHICQKEGMDFPAILGDCISVGAVFGNTVDASQLNGGKRIYTLPSLASTEARGWDSFDLTPFSQRLPFSVLTKSGTVVCAPGDDILVAHKKDNPLELVSVGYSRSAGTSLSAPAVSGAILLMQHYYFRSTGQFLSVDEIQQCLLENAISKEDLPSIRDDVKHFRTEYKVLQLKPVMFEVRNKASDTRVFSTF